MQEDKVMAYFDNEMKQINDKYSPLPSLKIARYISIRKLESMLSTKTLFFCNPEKFADKFEGEIPESYFKNWDNESKEVYQKINKWRAQKIVPYISCWTSHYHGNDVMWKKYAGENENGDGACIVTDVKRLMDCVSPFDGRVYEVRYLTEEDLLDKVEVPFYIPSTTKSGKLQISAQQRVFYALKRIKYEKEHEIRAIIFSEKITKGLSIPIELGKFIDNIIVNPMASATQKAAIEDLAKEYNVEDKLSEEIT